MKTRVSLLAVIALLITGCSTPTPESKPEYDEVELMVYQVCLERILDDQMKFRPQWDRTSSSDIEYAKEDCKKLLPIKK